MFPYVVPWLGDDMAAARQNDYFLVASLFAAHQGSWPADKGTPSNLGASFRLLAAKTDSGSIEKRFAALLSAGREDLPEHLRHGVSLLRAHEVPVDWARLLHDLRGWNWESRSVQRAWAQAFWHA
jgi:CRISPR system Cascade subunit CasB